MRPTFGDLMDMRVTNRQNLFIDFMIDVLRGGNYFMINDNKLNLAAIVPHKLKKELKWRGMLIGKPHTARPQFEFIYLTPRGMAHLQELRCQQLVTEWATQQNQ